MQCSPQVDTAILCLPLDLNHVPASLPLPRNVKGSERDIQLVRFASGRMSHDIRSARQAITPTEKRARYRPTRRTGQISKYVEMLSSWHACFEPDRYIACFQRRLQLAPSPRRTYRSLSSPLRSQNLPYIAPLISVEMPWLKKARANSNRLPDEQLPTGGWLSHLRFPAEITKEYSRRSPPWVGRRQEAV